MNLQRRIEALGKLGGRMASAVSVKDEAFEIVYTQAYQKNNWFTRENIERAMISWSALLSENNISGWLNSYQLEKATAGKRVGVINAGNIPLVGLHDMVSVLACGHSYIGKNSSDDSLLLPFITSLLIEIEPAFKSLVRFVDRLSDFDAVIATGSNNSALYFESYFGKYPHVIRRNRNGVAVLSGNETKDDLENLGKDIFEYFGLGCRNVSKLYVPADYEFANFFESIYSFNAVMQHNKYMNNFDYNSVMLLMKQVPFLQNNFLIIREDERIASPIAVIHYERYSDMNSLSEKLDASGHLIQCVVTGTRLNFNSELRKRMVRFGEAQSPALEDYADGVDTIRFLSSL
jgi:hypothetical protein